MLVIKLKDSYVSQANTESSFWLTIKGTQLKTFDIQMHIVQPIKLQDIV